MSMASGPWARRRRPRRKSLRRPPAAAAAPAEKPPEKPEEAPIVTHHEIHAGAKDAALHGDGRAHAHQVGQGRAGGVDLLHGLHAGRASTDIAKRPLMFSFNGGPGSSSVWLHLGAHRAPARKMLDDGGMPAPPFMLVDNEQTWLDQAPTSSSSTRRHRLQPRERSPSSDRSSGISTATSSRSSEFIRLYLTRATAGRRRCFWSAKATGPHARPASSGDLIDQRHCLQRDRPGLVNPQFPDGGVHEGQRPAVRAVLPTYAATAWYHKRLAPELQADFQATMKQVEAFALGPVRDRAGAGDQLPTADRAAKWRNGRRATQDCRKSTSR